MTDARDIIRAAMPGATDAACSDLLWSRTCHPFGPVSARTLYRAASGYARAQARGRVLCTFCNRAITTGRIACEPCDAAICGASEE